MKKILFAFWLTLLVSQSAFSQIWQAYKGVWLKGYDNATQAPIPPTGYSALTYFADSLGTYVYDWDSLAWLRIPGAGGGGSAGLTTASNGLNVNPAGNVKLGGTLTENTNIVGGGFTLNISSTSGSDNGLFEVRPTQNRSQVSSSSSSVTETMQDDAYSLVMTDNATYSNTFSISPSNMRLFRSGSAFTYAGEMTLGSTGITLSHGLANGRALTFNGTTTNRVYRMSSDLNNSIDFNFANSGQSRISTTDRLIINGGTVEMPAITENTNLTDSVMMLDGNGRIFWKTISGGGGGFTTADNGLTASSATNVQLGGTLIKNTTIPLAGFSYTVGQFPDNVNFSVDDASNSITANLSAGSNGALFSMTASNAVLQHSGSSGSATLTLDQSTETATISSSSGSALDINVSVPDSVQLSVGDVDMWINDADNDISMGTAISRLKFDFSNPAQPAIGVTEPFAGVNATLTLRTAGNGGFFIEKDVPGETYFTMAQSGTMQLGSNQVGGEFWTISAVNPTSDAKLSLNAQQSIRLVPGNNFVQIGSASGGTYIVGGGTNGSPNGNGTNIVIQPGVENGSGTPGNITIDQLNGFLILANLPTADPCGSAPTGTVWSDSGTLKICP